MENDSLASLGTFLDDTLYLLSEDRKKLEEELFGKNSLARQVEVTSVLPASSSSSVEKETTPVEFLPEPLVLKGDFTKGILILHEETSLPTSVMEMLVNMLRACGHSMSEVGMLSSEAIENRSMEEFQALNARVVLKFGRIKHPLNHLPFPSYEIHTEEESEFLFADTLSTISEDKTLKRKLWTALQHLFNLA